jgi:hypothetical protein
MVKSANQLIFFMMNKPSYSLWMILLNASL